MSDYMFIDTNTMAIEEIDGHPGALRQLLLSGETGTGQVQIVYGPPGFTGKIRELLESGTHRHVHRTVNERHYVLEGDYPIWHWPTPSAPGSLTRIRRHHYLENPPMTLHGITPDATSETGWKILQWTDGFGTELYQPGAEIETLEVGFDGGAAEHASYQSPILFAASSQKWERHAENKDWLIKPLSPDTAERSAVALVNIPPGAISSPRSPDAPGEGWRWLFMVSGDLQVTIDRAGLPEVIGLSEGCFLAWPADRQLGFPPGSISEGGAVALCVGHRIQA